MLCVICITLSITVYFVLGAVCRQTATSLYFVLCLSSGLASGFTGASAISWGHSSRLSRYSHHALVDGRESV